MTKDDAAAKGALHDARSCFSTVQEKFVLTRVELCSANCYNERRKPRSYCWMIFFGHRKENRMRNLMETLAKYAILRALIYLMLGFLMLFFPNSMIHILVYILAAYLIIQGIINLVLYFRRRSQPDTAYFEIVSGVFFLILGLVLIVFLKPIISIVPIILGILIVLNGTIGFVQAIDAKKYGMKSGVAMILYNVVLVIVGIILMLNPFASVTVLFRVFGIIMIVMGIMEIINFFIYRKAK